MCRDPSSETPFVPVRVSPDANKITEGGAVRFHVVWEGVSRDAFVVRHRVRLHGYLNACRHQFRNLDWGDAHFFDDAYDALVCVHHGARYRPETGACVDGPCDGGRLTPLAFEEREGELWCVGVAL